jgi:hypothetical protein
MVTAFPKSWFVLNHRVVIWFPKATRECSMYGFHWKNNIIGVAVRREDVDPRQEVYYERARDIAQLLEKEDNMQITLLGPSGCEKSPSVSVAPEASPPLATMMESRLEHMESR